MTRPRTSARRDRRIGQGRERIRDQQERRHPRRRTHVMQPRAPPLTMATARPARSCARRPNVAIEERRHHEGRPCEGVVPGEMATRRRADRAGTTPGSSGVEPLTPTATESGGQQSAVTSAYRPPGASADPQTTGPACPWHEAAEQHERRPIEFCELACPAHRGRDPSDHSNRVAGAPDHRRCRGTPPATPAKASEPGDGRDQQVDDEGRAATGPPRPNPSPRGRPGPGLRRATSRPRGRP